MKLSSEGRAAITLLTTPITLLTMVRTCVSGWTWSSGSQDDSPRRRGGGSDGEEDVRRDRYLRDLHALACGPVEERDRRQPGAVAEHGPQVRGRGGGRGPGAGRP